MAERENTMPKVFEQRPYQQTIIQSAHQGWQDNMGSQLVESPPGSGKTVMGFNIIKNLIADSRKLLKCDASDVGVGWVAMRRNLLVQAEKENLGMIGCPNVHFISMFDKDPGKDLMRYKHRIIVLDEAHHEATDSFHHTLNVLAPKYMLGLSATPVRADRAKLCFERVLKDAGFYTLIEDGYLSKFNQWMLDNWAPETVVRAYLADQKRWGKSIMFFLDRKQCDKAMGLLLAAGVKADLVTGETDRFAQLDAFEKGETDVLVNMYVLTEGFDCPELQTVFVRDSSMGPTVQMAGRVLRKHPGCPIKNIVQSVDSEYPFVRTANAAAQYVQIGEEWRTVGKSDLMRVMEARMLQRIALAKVEIPAYIKTKMMSLGRRRRRLRNGMLGGGGQEPHRPFHH